MGIAINFPNVVRVPANKPVTLKFSDRSGAAVKVSVDVPKESMSRSYVFPSAPVENHTHVITDTLLLKPGKYKLGCTLYATSHGMLNRTVDLTIECDGVQVGTIKGAIPQDGTSFSQFAYFDVEAQ